MIKYYEKDGYIDEFEVSGNMSMVVADIGCLLRAVYLVLDPTIREIFKETIVDLINNGDVFKEIKNDKRRNQERDCRM